MRPQAFAKGNLMSRLDSHVGAVQRKLTFAIFIEWLGTAAFVLAVLALLVVLINKVLRLQVPLMLLLVGAGIIFILAMVMAMLRRPSTTTAAIAIDARLGLKEKFSTALCVRPLKDPVARAVVRDAEQTANNISLSGQFPLSFPRPGYYAVAVAVLALLAAMFMPSFDPFGRRGTTQARQQEQARLAQSEQILKEAIVKIESVPRAMQDNDQIRIAREMLQTELKNVPADPAIASRRVIEALSKVDDALKQKVAEAQRHAQIEKNMMSSSLNPPVDARGPVAEAHRKMVQGKYEEALDDLKNTINDFDKLAREDQKQAADQMQNMADQLQKMAQDPRAMEKLAEQLQQAGVNQEQIQQAQELMQQAAGGDPQAQQQLQQMQQQLQQAMQQAGANQQQMQQMQQAMQQAQAAAQAQANAGQMAQAAQQLAQAMAQCAQGGQADGQMADGQQQLQQALEQMQAMQQDAQQMQQMQQAMQQAMAQAGGQCAGGQGQWQPGDPNKPGQGQGGPGIGAGGGGDKEPAPFAVKGERDVSPLNEKGQHLASVMIKDRSVRGESVAQLQEMLSAGQADAGDDIDDTRATQRAQEVQRRYFQTMADVVRETK
jgi:hypothetical protein